MLQLWAKLPLFLCASIWIHVGKWNRSYIYYRCHHQKEKLSFHSFAISLTVTVSRNSQFKDTGHNFDYPDRGFIYPFSVFMKIPVSYLTKKQTRSLPHPCQFIIRLYRVKDNILTASLNKLLLTPCKIDLFVKRIFIYSALQEIPCRF
jgi:hypothetical protein